MFLNLPSEIAYSNHWLNLPFEARISTLKCGHMRVAYYYDYPDGSTFRYRVHNMIQALELLDACKKHREISAAWFCYNDGKLIDQVPEIADVLVICRARYSERINSLITRAKNLGRRVIFDVDDLVFDPQYAHLLMYSLDQDPNSEALWDSWFGYIGRIGATMRMCDHVVVTNAYLASHVSANTKTAVSIIPNFVNREQLEVSARLYDMKLKANFDRDKRIHIGYFSGSPSHNRDFEIVSCALANLMTKNPNLILRIAGYLDIKGPISHFSDRIERFAMLDYLNLQRLIASTEINIVPLQDNIFTNCKSELKFFEAAIVGTPTVASPTYVFANGIRDGENGWTANAQEWRDKLTTAIHTLTVDSTKFQEIVNCARQDALKKFSWQAQCERIRSMLWGESLVDEQRA